MLGQSLICMSPVISPVVTPCGEQSTLADISQVMNLNFMLSTPPAGISFSRASVATDIIGGLLTVFPSGSPRSSSSNGILLEGQATNLTTQSESLTSWSPSAATHVLDNAAVNPYGATGCRILRESTAASTTHSTTFNHTGLNSNSLYTWSIFVKSTGTGRNVRIVAFSGVDMASCIFNPDTGAILSGAGTYGVIPLGNGWYRVYVSGLTGSSATNAYGIVQMHNGSSTVYTGDGTSGVYLFGGQFEAGAMTSYIPTTSAAATRAADQLYQDMTGLVNAVEGTIYADYTELVESAALSGSPITLTDDTSDNFVAIKHVAASNNINLNIAKAGSSLADLLLGSKSLGAQCKAAAAYKDGLCAGVISGGSVVPAAVAVPAGMTKIYIGVLFNGYMRNVRYYNKRKTDAELQAMTA